MKLGLMAGITIGAVTTAVVMADMKMTKVLKKGKKAVINKLEDIFS